jgi:hypothetical protein
MGKKVFEVRLSDGHIKKTSHIAMALFILEDLVSERNKRETGSSGSVDEDDGDVMRSLSGPYKKLIPEGLKSEALLLVSAESSRDFVTENKTNVRGTTKLFLFEKSFAELFEKEAPREITEKVLKDFWLRAHSKSQEDSNDWVELKGSYPFPIFSNIEVKYYNTSNEKVCRLVQRCQVGIAIAS